MATTDRCTHGNMPMSCLLCAQVTVGSVVFSPTPFAPNPIFKESDLVARLTAERDAALRRAEAWKKAALQVAQCDENTCTCSAMVAECVAISDARALDESEVKA